jgi:hypothetical protein
MTQIRGATLGSGVALARRVRLLMPIFCGQTNARKTVAAAADQPAPFDASTNEPSAL